MHPKRRIALYEHFNNQNNEALCIRLLKMFLNTVFNTHYLISKATLDRNDLENNSQVN